MSQVAKNPFASSGVVTSVTGINGVAASPTTGDVVVSGVNATTSTVGVASFNSSEFTVSGGGEVSLASTTNIDLPDTNSGGTQGEIVQNGNRVLSNYPGGTAYNFFLGPLSGNTSNSGSNNVGIGYQSLDSLTSGIDNVALGNSSLSSLSTGGGCVAIGYNALTNNNSTGSVAVGYSALSTLTSGTENTAVGFESLTNTNGSQNTALGYAAGNLSTGSQNTAVGCNSLSSTGAGGASTQNTLIGYGSGFDMTSASQNSALGYLTLNNLQTGSYNIAIGLGTGSNYTSSESSNILIASSGTIAESNTLRIGTQGTGNGQVDTCYIAGITGATVTGTAVLCSTSGQLGTISSSIRYKENVQDIEEEVSIMNLRPVSFNYKKDDLKTKMYGLIAEEVDKDFPYLCFYKEDGIPESVKYHEIPTLLLMEIKRLNKRIEKLEEILGI